MKFNYCCIYKITSPSKKIYIGQTINYSNRISRYERLDCKKQRKLYASLKKYGFKNHKFEIIKICERCDLNELEKYYIELFQTFNNKNGLNLCSGGNNYALSEETKQKIGKSNKGKLRTLDNIKKAVEVRKKNGSYIAWNKGKKGVILPNKGSFKKGIIGNNFDYILQKIKEGKTQTELAKELGVTSSGISQSLSRYKLKLSI